MRRYWIESPILVADKVEISGDTFHHIFDVCRNHIGSEFELLGIKPNIALKVQVTEIGKKKALAKIVSERAIPTLAFPRVVLNLSVPKIPTLETIVEKAVELGVERVQLFTSQYSFIRTPKDFSVTKFDRLKKIIMHATQQSGRGDLMKIMEPQPFSDILKIFTNQYQKTTGLLAYESLSSPLSLKSKLTKLALTSPQEIWLFVGSEGGFSSTEVEDAQRIGIEPISLGSQILRVETACVVLIGILKYELELI